MNQEILNQPMIISEEKESDGVSNWRSFIPFMIAIFGSIALVMLRINVGGERFIADGALMMIALACYLMRRFFI